MAKIESINQILQIHSLDIKVETSTSPLNGLEAR